MSSNPRSPLDLCPIEVWRKIFTCLKGRDLLSCYKTAESWRVELASRKTEIFMSDVFPPLSQYLEQKDVLNMRLGCSSWKEAIDDFVQNHPSRYNVLWLSLLVEEEVHRRQYVSDFFSRNLDFNSRFDRRRYANFVSNVPDGCNPFLCRSIDYFDNTYFPDDRAVLTQILERFGPHIWHFQLTMEIENDGMQFNSTAIYNVTRSWLLLMPNLKSLRLHFWPAYGYHRIEKSEFIMTPEKEELIRNHPLPLLNGLITLKLRGVINPLEYALFRQYGHIQKLSLECQGSFEPLFKDSLGTVHMARLEELNIDPRIHKDFMELRSMSMTSAWPLRILSLNFHGNFNDDNWEPMFRAISHFGGTLRHLGMRLSTTFSKLTLAELFNSDGASLELPHLETLKLANTNTYKREDFFTFLDFLQPCVSLRILDLTSLSQYSMSSLAPLLSCPLRTIRLTLLEDTDLWMVLRTVSHLGATLQHLELNGEFFVEITADSIRTHSYLSIDRLNSPVLALPRLETFTIKCGRLVVDSLDFIQRCTSLEKLVFRALHTPRIPVKDLHQVIQFRGYFAKMNESNIWTLLPHLEVFELNMRANAPLRRYKEYEEPVRNGFVEDLSLHRIYTRTGYIDVLPPPDDSD